MIFLTSFMRLDFSLLSQSKGQTLRSQSKVRTVYLEKIQIVYKE